MSEKMLLAALFAIYLNTVVGRLAYIIGKDRGRQEERGFRKNILGVGTLWRVGDDGRLHRVYEEDE